MRTLINRNTQINVLANRQDRIVVAMMDVLRAVVLAQPLFSGLFQAPAGYQSAIKRSLKSAAAGTTRAAETMLDELVSGMHRLSRCWHTQRVMPHFGVVRVVS